MTLRWEGERSLEVLAWCALCLIFFLLVLCFVLIYCLRCLSSREGQCGAFSLRHAPEERAAEYSDYYIRII